MAAEVVLIFFARRQKVCFLMRGNWIDCKMSWHLLSRC